MYDMPKKGEYEMPANMYMTLLELVLRIKNELNRTLGHFVHIQAKFSQENLLRMVR